MQHLIEINSQPRRTIRLSSTDWNRLHLAWSRNMPIAGKFDECKNRNRFVRSLWGREILRAALSMTPQISSLTYDMRWPRSELPRQSRCKRRIGEVLFGKGQWFLLHDYNVSVFNVFERVQKLWLIGYKPPILTQIMLVCRYSFQNYRTATTQTVLHRRGLPSRLKINIGSTKKLG